MVTYPADWDKFGRAAGPIRNQQMLDEGKPNMINKAKKANIPTYEILS